MGRLRERRPLLALFGGVYVLVPIWLGAPRPAWPPKSLMKRGLPRIFGEVPSHRDGFDNAGRIKRSEQRTRRTDSNRCCRAHRGATV